MALSESNTHLLLVRQRPCRWTKRHQWSPAQGSNLLPLAYQANAHACMSLPAVSVVRSPGVEPGRLSAAALEAAASTCFARSGCCWYPRRDSNAHLPVGSPRSERGGFAGFPHEGIEACARSDSNGQTVGFRPTRFTFAYSRIDWYRRRASIPHDLAVARRSTWCVCLFRHAGMKWTRVSDSHRRGACARLLCRQLPSNARPTRDETGCGRRRLPRSSAL